MLGIVLNITVLSHVTVLSLSCLVLGRVKEVKMAARTSTPVQRKGTEFS